MQVVYTLVGSNHVVGLLHMIDCTTARIVRRNERGSRVRPYSKPRAPPHDTWRDLVGVDHHLALFLHRSGVIADSHDAEGGALARLCEYNDVGGDFVGPWSLDKGSLHCGEEDGTLKKRIKVSSHLNVPS